MRPLEFHEYAVRLAAQATSEAEYRSAISRLYYGLHHEACCRYFRSGNAPPLQRSRRHTELRDRFHALRSADAIEMGRILGLLLRLREQADYEISNHFRVEARSLRPDEAMRHSLAVAGKTLAALDRFSPGAAPDGCRCNVVWSTR